MYSIFLNTSISLSLRRNKPSYQDLAILWGIMAKACLYYFAHIHDWSTEGGGFFCFQIMSILLFYWEFHTYTWCALTESTPFPPFQFLLCSSAHLLIPTSSAVFLKPAESTSHCLCMHSFCERSQATYSRSKCRMYTGIGEWFHSSIVAPKLSFSIEFS